MRVTPGTRLGPYEILAPLGAGGMGEVYRARDSRLSREVAVKVLPAQMASDPDLRRRLDREAQAISSLSHPNICALFDIGHVDGVDFLVMELLDGETLSARLTRGALPIDQVLRHGIEIADALAALLLAVGTVARHWNAAVPPGPAVRASLLPPPAHSFTPNDFAVSPDGRRVAFVAAGADGVSTLWVSSLQTGQADEIAGSEGAISPFWSADSRWIAFFVHGKLLKVEPGGAGMQSICEVAINGRGGAWNANDVILFSQVVLGPVMKVSASGGTPVPVTRVPPEMQGEAHRFPQFLPDGERFVYVASWTNLQRGGLYLGALDGRAPELLSSDIHGRVIVVGTDILYVREGILYVQGLDATTGKLTGAPRALLRNEAVVDWRFGEVPVRAAAGLLLFQSRLNYNSQLVWHDRTGRELGVVGKPGFVAPELSNDGRRAFVQYDPKGTGEHGLWSLDLGRGLSSPLESAGNHTAHRVFPDGSLLYSVQRKQNGVYRRPADGSGVEETLFESPAHVLVNGASPDGQRVLIMDFARGLPEVRELDVRTRKSSIIGVGAEGAYSSDGAWIAYVAASGGEATIMHRATRRSIQLSQGGGWQIRWRHDMKEIFYVARDKKLMSVTLTRRGDDLEPSAPVPLFQTRIVAPTLVLFQYAATPDGEKFLINSLPREDTAAPLTILTNWK